MKPAPRAELLKLANRHDVAIIATGHLHRCHENAVDGRRYIWGAASGFVVGPALQPPMPGRCRLGTVIYDFSGTEAAISRADVPGLTTLWIDDVIHDVYPPRPAV